MKNTPRKGKQHQPGREFNIESKEAMVGQSERRGQKVLKPLFVINITSERKIQLRLNSLPEWKIFTYFRHQCLAGIYVIFATRTAKPFGQYIHPSCCGAAVKELEKRSFSENVKVGCIGVSIVGISRTTVIHISGVIREQCNFVFIDLKKANLIVLFHCKLALLRNHQKEQHKQAYKTEQG